MWSWYFIYGLPDHAVYINIYIPKSLISEYEFISQSHYRAHPQTFLSTSCWRLFSHHDHHHHQPKVQTHTKTPLTSFTIYKHYAIFLTLSPRGLLPYTIYSIYSSRLAQCFSQNVNEFSPPCIYSDDHSNTIILNNIIVQINSFVHWFT